MKNITYLAVFLSIIFIPLKIFSQNIVGKVIDKNNNSLELAAVAAINPSDSVLVSYTNTDKSGNFKLTNLEEGTYLFQVHLVGFDTYQKIIILEKRDLNLHNIVLDDKSNLLNEIVLDAFIAISIKKDTVVYDTKAFKIRVEDNVEDLLKKLPGVEIDASGNITAHGEEVSKIYVDGKEFFGNDPKVATKNLSADAIKKIEVIDEKSEKSRVTGINDSENNKVINLQLKDDKKVNDFGKAQGGYGTDNRYLTSLNYNRFSPKMQVSLIGLYNNINSTGSDISEIMDFSRGGRVLFGGGNNNPTYGYLTTGIGGVNLGYEFRKDQNLNTDYFYNYNKATTGEVQTSRIEFINDQEIRTESLSDGEDITNSHKANFNYRDRSKKLSSLVLRGNINTNNSESVALETLDKYNGNGELDLVSAGRSKSSGENSSGNITMEYVQRLQKDGKRNFKLDAGFGGDNSERTSSNLQQNDFNVSNPEETYQTNTAIYKEAKTNNYNYNFNLKYSEPLAENHVIEIDAGVSTSIQNEDVDQSNLENGIPLNPLIYELNYDNTNLVGGIFYNFNNEKIVFNTGLKIAGQNQKFGLKNEQQYDFSYTNYNPSLFFRYRPKRSTILLFRVENKVNLASINQLSPVINDFNPLFITYGNPNLSPENQYTLFGLFNNFNFTTGFNINARINYSYKTNAIVSSQFTNNLGIRFSTFENSGDRDDLNANFRIGKRVESLQLRYNLNLKGGLSNYQSIINNQINKTKSKNGAIGLSLENNTKDKIDASFGADFSKDFATFTAGNTSEREFFQQSYFAKAAWNITNKINLDSQFKYDIYKDSNFGSDQSVPIWNASVSYAVLKGNSLNIKLSALDILNESIGLIRNSADNYYEEVNREVLGSYYMLSLTYLLNGNKNPNANNRGNQRGIRMNF